MPEIGKIKVDTIVIGPVFTTMIELIQAIDDFTGGNLKKDMDVNEFSKQLKSRANTVEIPQFEDFEGLFADHLRKCGL